MSAFEGLPKALRTLCVRDGRPLQDIAFASKISPAMLSSYLTGRESPTLKTLEKLLDGLKLRLEDLAEALNDIQGYERPRPARVASSEDLLLGFPREEVERVFVDQLRRLGLEPKKEARETPAPTPTPAPPTKPRKSRKA
jgi:transcriptional regulator with XRE-family HTH domain